MSRRYWWTAARRPARPAPAFGPVVLRHDLDRTVRRSTHGRRRFCFARRRNQFRHRTRTRRDGAARRALRHRRPLERLPQSRSPAGDQRAERDAADPAHSDFDAHQQSRIGAHSRLRPRLRQSVADGVRSLRQHPAVQSAKAARRCGRRRRADAGRGAGRRSVLRHLRLRRFGAAQSTKSRPRSAISIRCCRRSGIRRCCRSTRC